MYKKRANHNDGRHYMFLGSLKFDRQTVRTTLMVTTSYEEAVPARTAFFVLAARCGRYVTCVNLIKSTIVHLR